jgi:small RNA 2'-O-methyltransferase
MPTCMATELHEQRLDIVTAHLVASGARSVLDLGCGPGELLARLAPHPQFERIVGIDVSVSALAHARELIGSCSRIELMHASFSEPDPGLAGFDIAALVETIEHIDPHRLAEVEQAVFGSFRPAEVLVTTPNQEFNVLHGMRPGSMRHPDHRFEWNRARFRAWARAVAARHGYGVYFCDVGEADPELGASTQMARFERKHAA